MFIHCGREKMSANKTLSRSRLTTPYDMSVQCYLVYWFSRFSTLYSTLSLHYETPVLPEAVVQTLVANFLSILYTEVAPYIESLSRALSTRFKPLYTNMYHLRLLDGAVLRYVSRLKTHVAISIYYVNKKYL